MKTLRTIIAGLATAALSVLPVSADVIFKGARGPTDWQLDERVGYSTNEKHVSTVTDTLIMKYWDGKATGKWFFASVPYRHVHAPNDTQTGFGDITLGIGPRGTVGNLHFLTYGGITVPSGSSDSVPALGNGRYDAKCGMFVTYLTPGKGFEIDGSLEYTITGENRKKVNPPNEFAPGVVIGGKLGTFRAAAGLTGTFKDNGDHILNARGILRYVISPKMHFEAIGDRTVQHKNMPKATSVTGIVRYNF